MHPFPRSIAAIASFTAGLILVSPAPAGSAVVLPPHPTTSPEMTAADLSARDKILSDDVFQGRGPGTPAGERAADWIADEMKRIGLKRGNHGSYFQNVPSVAIALDGRKSSFSLATSQGAMTPKFPDEVAYWTPHFASGAVKVTNAPLIFVGYGVVAPEYNWNDYTGVDVKGKAALILINDPGNEDANPNPAFFKGKAMTYYGRWTYKYEEAARQGAAAAVIIHETKPAAYGWQVVRNSNSGNKLWLDAKDKNAADVAIEGWITLDAAKELFKRAGLDYEKEKAAANQQGFKAVPLTGEALSVEAHSRISHLKTRNVIGVVPGYKHPSDYVLYTAHWDHLGVKLDVAGPDKIYNGAIDNALGVSSILEMAEAFTHEKRPQRTIAFIGWTLEEQGLLGSQYFAERPIWPVSHIVGGLNIDAPLPEGRAHDLTLVGSDASELEPILASALKTQNRTIAPDPEPEKGYFYRSDHISLAKVGVPMIDPQGGYDLVEGGKEAGQALRNEYREHHYHQPSDEWHSDWNLDGPISDLRVLYTFGDTLANSESWPDWYQGNEFRAAREKSIATKRR